MIKKILPKFVTEKGNVWYVRRSFRDADGIRRQVWRKCETQDESCVQKVLAQVDDVVAKRRSGVVEKSFPSSKQSLFKTVAEKFRKAELIAPVYIGLKKVAGKKSVARYEYQLKMLIAHFGNRDITEITFNDCYQFKLKRLQTPVKTKYGTRQRAIRTVHLELSTLRQVFNFAIRERILNRSPFQDGKGLICPSDDNRRFVELSDAEQAALIENCPAYVPYLKIVVIGCLDAGFRLGEILKLTWRQVDFGKNEIRLFNYQTKTAKERTIPMSTRFRETLLEWKKTNGDGEKVLNVSYIRKVWHKLRESIGRDDLTIHDLRHAFATNLHKRGVNIVTIQKLLGHANIETTIIYINPSNDELHDAIRVLD